MNENTKVTLSTFSNEPDISRSELSSLSRLQSHSQKFDTGTISAFRDNYSLKQNNYKQSFLRFSEERRQICLKSQKN